MNNLTKPGIALGLLLAGCAMPHAAFSSTGLEAVSLVTNASDPDLVNAWGISHSGGSPFWVSDNGTGKSTIYKVDPITNATTKQGLVVSIPGDGTPTGQVFNGAGGFNNDLFLFASEDGTISGWRGALGTTAETLQIGSAANVYKGVALGAVGGNNYLYAANFRTGAIDVLKGTGAAPSLTGNFADPTLPSGYAPFNIQNLGGKLYVTYAEQDPTKHDDVAGAGHGFVDSYDLNGNFLGRVGTAGALNSPWGLAVAPTSFGSFAGDLLVGNFGDGSISMFDQTTNSYLGQVKDAEGNDISIDGLWGLSVGNGANAGSSSLLYFTAGPNGESGGEFGVLKSVPEPSAFAALGIGMFGLLALALRARKRKAALLS